MAPEGQATNKATIGVVIPAYGHPGFLVEAVLSACRQTIAQPVSVIVVDDGCRYPETQQTIQPLLGEFPGVLHYLRKKNGGLSSARNAGVEFLMALETDVEAIYFLDADNKLEPYALANYRAALGTDASIGWAYPDIAFFGLTSGSEGFDIRETAPEYSALKHLLGNISEAGSMVRTSVFRAGARFDEDMKSGFEDWDFWLTVLELGFKGTRVEHPGFLYRRRPESMLAESRRLEEELISRMRRKHIALFSPKPLMEREHIEAPFFAVISPECNALNLTSDPLLSGSDWSLDQFEVCFRRWVAGDQSIFFPAGILSITSRARNVLKRAPFVMRSLFWYFKECKSDIVAVRLTWQEDSLKELVTEAGARIDDPDILFVRCDRLLGHKGLHADVAEHSWHAIELNLPSPVGKDLRGPVGETGNQLLEFVSLLFSMPVASRAIHMDRRYAGPAARDVRSSLIDDICAPEGRRAYPICSSKYRVLVAVDCDLLAENVSLERVTCLLEKLASLGAEVTLVVEYANDASVCSLNIEAWQDLIADLRLVNYWSSSEAYKVYLGRRLAVRLPIKAKEDCCVVAYGMDLMISIGGLAGLSYMGYAKTFGVLGYMYLDNAFLGRDEEASSLLGEVLAYEHAVNGVITNDIGYRASLVSEGFPSGKFIELEAFYEKLRESFGSTGS